MKVEIGVGKGKTHSDQRQDLKKSVELREAQREMARFNHVSDWRTAPPAPLDMGIQRDGLRNIAMPKRGPGDI